MEHKKMIFTAAILEIIAGAIWLMSVLTLLPTVRALNSGVILVFVQLFLSVFVIYAGVLYCSGRVLFAKCSNSMNIFICVIMDWVCVFFHFFIFCFGDISSVDGLIAMGVGVLPMVLLVIASFFFYFCVIGRDDHNKTANTEKK